MSSLPAEPSFKDKISASWMRDLLRYVRSLTPVAGPGVKVSRGPNGTVYSAKSVKASHQTAPDPLHPWKLFAVGKSEEVDHFFEIYIPEGSIVCGSEVLEVEGVEETETADRYVILCEGDVGVEEPSTLYLVVYKDEDEDDEDGSALKSKLVVNIEDYKDDESVTNIIPIAALAIVEGENFDTGRIVSQIQKEAILIQKNVSPDKISIDFVTDADAEDPDAIQIKDFDNKESDGRQGLAERLDLKKTGSGDKATYKIIAKSNESDVHLVARVNGKIKYIPLTGAEDPDPDEEEDNPEKCQHDDSAGKEGGVNPEKEERHGGGGATGGGGGVNPDKDLDRPHPGDDPCQGDPNCNC